MPTSHVDKVITENTRCPVEVSLALLGGKYKTLILWNLMDQTMRFSQLRRAIPAATPKMLTQQLRELETDGLINRKVYAQVPARVEYSLTGVGNSVRPILQSLYDWGSSYLQDRGLTAQCSMKPIETSAGVSEMKSCDCPQPHACCCHSNHSIK